MAAAEDPSVSNFYVGQKVVCIDAEKTNARNIPELREGATYIVRELCGRCYDEGRPWQKYNGTYCLRLEGIFRKKRDCPFSCLRFRPLDQRKTDISVFTKSLTPRCEQLQPA